MPQRATVSDPSVSKEVTMSQISKPTAPKADTSSTREHADRFHAAALAFKDDDRKLAQAKSIDAFTGLVESPADVARGISDARARLFVGSPADYRPEEGSSKSYAEAVAEAAAGALSVSESTVSKYRAAWNLVTLAALPHESVPVFGDAWAIVTGGATRKAKAPAKRIALLEANARAKAFHRSAVALVGAAQVAAEARKAKAAEAAEARKAEAEAAEADPVRTILAAIGTLRDALKGTGEAEAIRALEAGLRLQAEDARRAADALEAAEAEADALEASPAA